MNTTTSRPKTIVLVLAFGDIIKLGANDGAIIRYQDTLRHLPEGVRPDMVINVAGYTKDSPQLSVKGVRTRSLSHQFYDYVRSNGLDQNVGLVIALSMCWSTINEVPEGFTVAQVNGAPKDDEVTVYIGSSDSYWHSRRIAMYAERCCPEKWNVVVVRSSHKMTWKERWIAEPFKYLRDRYRLSRQKETI